MNAKTMSAGFTVNDLDRSIQFYTQLGFEVEQRWERDGKLSGVMLRGGNAGIGIGQDDWKKGRDRVKGVGTRLWIVTDDDLDKLAERARSAGVADAKASDAPWGGRMLDITDPDGYAISFSNQG